MCFCLISTLLNDCFIYTLEYYKFTWKLTKILSLIASTTLAKEKQEVPSEENSAKAEVADNSEDCQVLIKFVHDSDVVSEHMQEY